MNSLRRYTYETNVEVSSGDDCGPDFDIKVSFTITPGGPETPPSYASGGSPAYPAEIDDIRLEMVDGKPRPWGMYDGYIKDEDAEFEATIVSLLENSDRHWEAMMQEVAEADRHRLDPKRAVRAVIICPDCDDGDFHEITHFDAEGRALNPATGKPFGLSAKPEARHDP